MTRFTLQISDQLNQWLTEQAALNHRSKNGQIEYLLEKARQEQRSNDLVSIEMKPDSAIRYVFRETE